MKYKWKVKRFWWSWIKQDMSKLWYRIIGVPIAHLPKKDKGKYVNVITSGPMIRMLPTNKQEYEVRLIPYQPNHGIFVEIWENGEVKSRKSID